jgi:hypothetical protein
MYLLGAHVTLELMNCRTDLRNPVQYPRNGDVHQFFIIDVSTTGVAFPPNVIRR